MVMLSNLDFDRSRLTQNELTRASMSDRLVLIVDDDPDLRALLAAWLEAEGLGWLEADCGAAALAKLATHPVDLVITDLQMP